MSLIESLKTEEEIHEEARRLLEKRSDLNIDLMSLHDIEQLTKEEINDKYTDQISLFVDETYMLLGEDPAYDEDLIQVEVDNLTERMEKERDEFVRSYKEDMLRVIKFEKELEICDEQIKSVYPYINTNEEELRREVEYVLKSENEGLNAERLLEEYHSGNLELDSEYGISSRKFDGEAIKYFVEHYIETNAGEKVLIKFPEHVKVRELRDDIYELEEEIYNVMNDPPEALEPNDSVVDLENELKNKNESLYYMTSNELNDRFNYNDPIELQDEKGNVYNVRGIESELEVVKAALVNYYLRDEYGEDYSPSDIQEMSEFVEKIDFTKPVYIAYTTKGDNDELEHNTLLDINNLTLSAEITGANVKYTEVIGSYESLKHLAQDIDGWDFDYLIAEDNLDYEEIIKEDNMLSKRDKGMNLEP